jgi:signal transduction histidine kinase
LVCENLLTNAIKYSPAGGPVRISATKDNGMAVITVSDQGVGIPPEEHSRIFERFYRIDNRLRREQQGFGLGLYLARAIVEAQHGQIWVESRVNHGSRFSFSVPLAVPKITGESEHVPDMIIELSKDTNNDGTAR